MKSLIHILLFLFALNGTAQDLPDRPDPPITSSTDYIYGGSESGIVGKIEDEYTVTPTGQFNYSIPVTSVPGTGGVVPQLSISYNSSNKRGLCGYGFDLLGLSVINRAPANLHRDNKVGAVNFSEEDKFMLDGMRLIIVQEQVQQTEYRTENNVFSKIVAEGEKSNPSKFIAYTKSGLIYEYLPFHSVGTQQAIYWYVDKVFDTKGNYYKVIYENKNQNGNNECVPIRIDYTGNTHAGLQPYASIRLEYIQTESSFAYIHGHKITRSHVVSKISIYNDDTCVRYYNFEYQEKNNLHFLTKVTESAQDGTKRNPTTFTWKNNTPSVLRPTTSSSDEIIKWANITIGDFNGDGKADFIATPIAKKWDGYYIYLSKGNTFERQSKGTFYTHTNNAFEISQVVCADFNGDGYDDIVVKRKIRLGATFYYTDLYLTEINNGRPSLRYIRTLYNAMMEINDEYYLKAIEVNGDGAADLLLYYKTPNQNGEKLYSIFRSTFSQNSVVPLKVKTGGNLTNYLNDVEVLDYNGDGLSDILDIKNTESIIYKINSSGLLEYVGTNQTFTKKHYYHLGDFNGDGKTDILITGKENDTQHEFDNNWQLKYSDGTGSFQQVVFPRIFTTGINVWTNVHVNNTKFFIMDINGDGCSDLFAVKKKNSAAVQPHIYLNDGTGGFIKFDELPSIHGTDKWYHYFGDFKGNGRAELLTTSVWYTDSWNGYKRYEMTCDENLLSSITDGMGNTTDVEYKHLTDQNVFERGNKTSYPLISTVYPIPVVSCVKTPNPVGGQDIVSYKYKNALFHKRGRGLLGFESFITKDETAHAETTSSFEVNETEYVMSLKSTRTTIFDRLVNETEYENRLIYTNNSNGGKSFVFVPISTVERSYEYNSGEMLSEVQTQTAYDRFGNVTRMEVVNGERTVTTENTYTEDEERWLLGRLTKTVVKKEDENDIIVRTSTFEYDAQSGLLIAENVEPESNAYGYRKTYLHDSYGNILESSIMPNDGGSARTQKTVYDGKGRYKIRSTDAMGFTTSYQLDDDLGVALSVTDANNVTTSYTYNAFGEQQSVTTPLTQGSVITAWNKWHEDAPIRAHYYIKTEETGTPTTWEFFDCLGRSLRKVTTGVNGRKIYTDAVYNAQRQLVKTSEPYFKGDAVYWNTNTYDGAGRVICQTYADGSSYMMSYNGYESSSTDPLGRTSVKVTDRYGNMVTSTDALGNSVFYEYNVLDKCTLIRGPRTVIQTLYDDMGNRVCLRDPDLGTTTYGYNALGELIWQEDAHGRTTFSYDVAGRMIREERPDITFTHEYDTKWKGARSKSTTSEGTTHEFFYDAYGRIVRETETIVNKTFTTAVTYNAINKVDELTYPSGLVVRNFYTTDGYLRKVEDAQNGTQYWYLEGANARGQVESEFFGDNEVCTSTFYNPQKGYITRIFTPGVQDWSYSFNEVGNLTGRTNNRYHLTETFEYDELDRLTRVLRNGTTTQRMTYDNAGNITYKTGVGYMTYEEGSNRLQSVTGGDYDLPLWEEINYSSFNKITSIRPDEMSPSMTLLYGTDKSRKLTKRYIKVPGPLQCGKPRRWVDKLVETRYYVGKLYENIVTNDDNREINYIFADGKAIAIFETSTKSGSKTTYLYHDHLGSIQAYSDENGGLLQELSYDAWGQRRDPQTWDYYEQQTQAEANYERGFTGHEHLDVFDMINMDGRMYDPIVGRFLSPDPYVQAPDYTQGLNRYAYCMNNPLSLVDPSGYSWFSKNWKSIISAAVGIAVGALTGGTGTLVTHALLGGACGGAAGALVGAILNGANFNQILHSTLTGAFWGAVSGLTNFGSGEIKDVFGKIFLHAFSECMQEGIRGGNWEHGLLMGAVSGAGGAFLTHHGRSLGKGGMIVANAVLSGTVSELGGGKFANGAITGAFAVMFNDLMHQKSYGGDDDDPWLAATTIAATSSAADGPLPIGEIIGIGSFVVAGVYDATQRIYLTYTLTGPGGKIYVGRTSGFGTPEQIMKRRYYSHHMRFKGYKNPKLDVWVQGIHGYGAIRGREQQLMDYHGGVGSPKLGNVIRGVSKLKVVSGRVYHKLSDRYFGNIAPYTGY